MKNTMKNLESLIKRKKTKVLKDFERRGYVENMGMKELREVQDMGRNVAYDYTVNWDERQNAGRLVDSFDRWLESL